MNKLILRERFNALLKEFGFDHVNWDKLDENKEEMEAVIAKINSEYFKVFLDKISELNLNEQFEEWATFLEKKYPRFFSVTKDDARFVLQNGAERLNKWFSSIYEIASEAFKDLDIAATKQANLDKNVVNFVDKYIEEEIKPKYNGNYNDSIDNTLKKTLTPFLEWLMKQV